MENLVYQTLQVDHLSRRTDHYEPDCDLFLFEDLKPNEWDYSLPTFASGDSNKIVASLHDFIDQFNKNIPFKINMDNILIAGGCIGNILIKQNSVRDIDIFVYGLNTEDATERVGTLINDLSNSYEKYLKERERERDRERLMSNKNSSKSQPKTSKSKKIEYEFKCIRNKNCISLIYDEKYVVQIILRIYKDKSEILHGFDLGSSAVGFDGENVYFTSLSKFAYEYSCNIIDTTRRSTTYERRLIKYFKRQFDIILPHMDISKMRNINSKYKLSDICELPYMVFSYSNITGNKIQIDRFLVPSNVDESDYQIENLDEYRIFYINLHNMVMGKEDYYFYVENAKNVIDAKPFLSRRKIIDYYDNLKDKLKKSDNINIRMLRKYVKDTKEILQLLVDNGDNDNLFMERLETGIQNEKQRILVVADELLAKSYPLNWLINNPGTQLTSSFNPIIEDESKWYAEFYTQTPDPQHVIKHIISNKRVNLAIERNEHTDSEDTRSDSEESDDDISVTLED